MDDFVSYCFGGLTGKMQQEVLKYARDIQRQIDPEEHINSLADLEGRDTVIGKLLSTDYFGWPSSLSWCIRDHGVKVRTALHNAKNFAARQAYLERQRRYESTGYALGLVRGAEPDEAQELLEQAGEVIRTDRRKSDSGQKQGKQEKKKGQMEFPF